MGDKLFEITAEIANIDTKISNLNEEIRLLKNYSLIKKYEEYLKEKLQPGKYFKTLNRLGSYSTIYLRGPENSDDIDITYGNEMLKINVPVYEHIISGSYNFVQSKSVAYIDITKPNKSVFQNIVNLFVEIDESEYLEIEKMAKETEKLSSKNKI